MAKKLTLGIAKIGDLLFRNKITITDCDTSIDDLSLRIPEYQRPYKWTAKNANQLLDDIEEAMNDNKEVYRVGTLILHYDEKDQTCNIVDGQQRTITFSLLLKCLSDAPIRFLEQKLAENAFNIHNVVNNFRVLGRRIDRLEDERDRNELLDYIENHCELIIVITDDLSEAFQFFDSQNARGKTLYPHDLLKAYHLREMTVFPADEVERIVKMWEELDQKKLSCLFNDYLYRLKEWINGNRAYELNEHNIDIFKGVTSRDNHPYAQYYKGAFAYADEINASNIPFVTGIQHLCPFQLNAPIIAGKPFFEYTKHYFDILEDIQNNDKYEGYFINDNEIIRTLNLKHYKNGIGNQVARLMLDTAILLYVDRFCPARLSKNDTEYLNQFVVYAFIWAYSMRAQYTNVGWQVAQNYIMGMSKKEGIINGFNIYKVISESDSPSVLLSRMADMISPLDRVANNALKPEIHEEEDGVFCNYLHFFIKYKFWRGI